MKNFKRALLFFIMMYAVVLPLPARAARVVTLEECLAAAEANHPSLTGADGQIASQRARLSQTAAGDRVSVDGSASVRRNGTSAGERDSYSAGVSAGVKVFDANRSKYSIDSERSTLAATEESKNATLGEILADVKSKYMTLLLNTEIAGHRLESVRAFEAYLEQAKVLYEVGLKPWYDVTKAEVDLGKAQLALLEAESGAEMAKASLFNAMGVDMPEDEYSLAPIDFEVPQLGGEDEILAEALKNRSDYRASDLKILAGQSSLKAAARAGSPSVSLSSGYNGSGQEVRDMEAGWDVGISVSIPILDGGAAKAGVDSAMGQLVSLEASREKLRQDIVLEVRQTMADIAKTRERIRISELNVASTEENRRIAMGRYETGAGSPFEVTDALLSYTDAVLENRQAMYDMQIAVATLERAIGKDL